MKICIAGISGYLGWNLACYLGNRNYEICGFDNHIREKLVKDEGADSLTPISSMPERLEVAREVLGVDIKFHEGDIRDYDFIESFLVKYKPDAIIHLAEIPSAPFSMKSVQAATLTQSNNVIGTLKLLWAMRKAAPEAHLVKLATLGEFGTPNIDIPDSGYFEVEYRGRKDRLPFPKQPGSLYHISKAMDTLNIQFVCKVWGLNSTDLQQGPVYGVYIPETRQDPRLISRYDYSGEFGTIINRYCVQALCDYPLTAYGEGFQTRGFIYIEDTMRCIEICIENPPKEEKGEHYRSFNQFFELHTVNDLAEKVKNVCAERGIEVKIENIENPRVEKERHYYNPSNEELLGFGIKYHKLDDMLPIFINDLIPFKDRVIKEAIAPKVKWR